MCWAKSTKLKSFRTFHLENFGWMDSPNILLSWSRLLTLYSSMRRAVNITHPHSIHLTGNNITLSSQTAKNIQNMKRLLLFWSIQLLQQSMNWINVQPDLCFQSRLFLEITGKGKSCYVIPHRLMNFVGGQYRQRQWIAWLCHKKEPH